MFNCNGECKCMCAIYMYTYAYVYMNVRVNKSDTSCGTKTIQYNMKNNDDTDVQREQYETEWIFLFEIG